jgi:hypothetical protein
MRTSSHGPVFLSESSHREQQDLSDLIRELNYNRFKECDIRVFTRQVSKPLEMIQTLNKMLQEFRLAKSIAVFTTKNKDEYVDIASTDTCRVVINENPTKRTNYHNVDEEHVLYVICRHASAATAYLHYIGSEIINQNQQTSPNFYTQESNISDVQEKSPEIESSSNIDYQPKDTIPKECTDDKS